MSVLEYGYLLQYPLAVFIMVLSLKNLYFKRDEILLTLLISCFGLFSMFFGLIKGLPINIRPFSVPFIFLLVVINNNNIKPKILKFIFILSLMILSMEYVNYYFNFFDLKTITRLGLLRPYGLFIDPHLSSLFIALCFYLYGKKYLGAIISLMMLSLQTAIAYSILFLKNNFLIFLIFSIIVLLVLNNVGHFSLDVEISMLHAYISIIDYGFSDCYIFGCASNEIILEGKSDFWSVLAYFLFYTLF